MLLTPTCSTEIGGGLIPANSALVFEVTLEGVEKPSLTIETLESGDCGRNDDKRVRRKDNVTLHYTATLAADGIHTGLYSEVHTHVPHTNTYTHTHTALRDTAPGWLIGSTNKG